jgi:hypothetical protein
MVLNYLSTGVTLPCYIVQSCFFVSWLFNDTIIPKLYNDDRVVNECETIGGVRTQRKPTQMPLCSGSCFKSVLNSSKFK